MFHVDRTIRFVKPNVPFAGSRFWIFLNWKKKISTKRIERTVRIKVALYESKARAAKRGIEFNGIFITFRREPNRSYIKF